VVKVIGHSSRSQDKNGVHCLKSESLKTVTAPWMKTDQKFTIDKVCWFIEYKIMTW